MRTRRCRRKICAGKPVGRQPVFSTSGSGASLEEVCSSSVGSTIVPCGCRSSAARSGCVDAGSVEVGIVAGAATPAAGSATPTMETQGKVTNQGDGADMGQASHGPKWTGGRLLDRGSNLNTYSRHPRRPLRPCATRVYVQPTCSSRGTTIAGYRVDGVLGQGGMGVVYEATQLSLDRVVALKLLAPHLSDASPSRRGSGARARSRRGSSTRTSSPSTRPGRPSTASSSRCGWCAGRPEGHDPPRARPRPHPQVLGPWRRPLTTRTPSA